MKAISQFTFLGYFLLFLENTVGKKNPTNGKDLSILPFSFLNTLQARRNSSGHVVSMSGTASYILEWLSGYLNFTYTVISDDYQTGSMYENVLRAIQYIVDGKADMFLGAYFENNVEFALLDYPYPWLLTRYVIMIPIPQSVTNVAAVWLPFSPSVWVSLLVGLVFVLLSFYALGHYVRQIEELNPRGNQISQRSNPNFQYMLEVIMQQGGWFGNDRFPIRLAAATWCLSGCVLVLAYYSVVISFVTSPNYVPLVNDIYDIVKKPGIYLTVEANLAPDQQYLGSKEGAGKLLGDMLRKHPDLRKNTTKECFDLVRGGSTVYIQEMLFTQKIMNDDLVSIGRCDFTLARETADIIILTFPMMKHSLYTEHISRAMMSLDSFGLITWWNKEFYPPPERCLNWNPPVGLPQLSLRGLSGAFLVLGVGYSLATITFIAEVLMQKKHLTTSNYGEKTEDKKIEDKFEY